MFTCRMCLYRSTKIISGLCPDCPLKRHKPPIRKHVTWTGIARRRGVLPY